MARFINLVDQWWPRGGSGPVDPVTGGAATVVHRLAGDEIEGRGARVEVIGDPGGIAAASGGGRYQAGDHQGRYW